MTIPSAGRVLLVDGHNLLHRACHIKSFTEMTTKGGFRVGGAYGFLKSLRKALDSSVFEKCLVAWDTGRSPRRVALHEEYKRAPKKKPKTEEEKLESQEYFEFFKLQKHFLGELLPHLGAVQLELTSTEGDDILYWARRLVDENPTETSGRSFVILSEDLDFMQMIRPDTDLFRPIQDQYLNLNNFITVAKVTPSRFLLYKSVLGDAGDNVPGIKGVGPVAAAEVANSVMVKESDYSMTPTWDWGEVQTFCAGHKSAKIRSIAGEMDRVKLNFMLVALTEEYFDSAQQEFLHDKIFSETYTDFDLAYQHIDKAEYATILEDYTSWIIPFRRL